MNLLRFIMEIFPEDGHQSKNSPIIPNNRVEGKRRTSKILEPKVYSFGEISVIQRTNIVDYGAVIVANGKGSIFTKLLRFHQDYKKTDYDSEEIAVSILDSQVSEKLNLSGRFWLSINYDEGNLRFLSSDNPHRSDFTVDKDDFKDLTFIATKSRQDLEKIFQFWFFKQKNKTKKQKSIWLFCNEGEALSRAIKRLVKSPSRDENSEVEFPGEQTEQTDMKILDGPETKTFRKNSQRKSGTQSNCGNTSPRSSVGFLNSFLRKSLTSLTELTSNSAHQCADTENASPTSKNRLSGTFLVSRRPTLPSLPSKQELERKESDRIYQQYLQKEVFRWETEGQYSPLAPCQQSRHSSSEMTSSKQFSFSEDHPDYQLPIDLPINISSQSETKKAVKTETKPTDPAAEYHFPMNIPISACAQAENSSNVNHSYVNLKFVENDFDEYSKLPLAPPLTENRKTETDSQSVNSLCLDSPIRPLSETKYQNLGGNVLQAVENSDYHILSQFISDKHVSIEDSRKFVNYESDV